MQASAGQGTTANYIVEVINTGSTAEEFSLAATLPPGISGVFGENTVDVPPGASNFRDIPLRLTPKIGTAPGDETFTVTATSTTNPSATASVQGSLTVLPTGVSVTLSPSSGAPGSGFLMTVTNTGQVRDTFNLSLGGAAGLVASLGQNEVTLAPGAAQTVPITTTAVNFAVPGSLQLVAVATSQTDPAVTSSASANLAIAPTQGMTAQFQPAEQTIAQPGPASTLLLVNDTGNTEDSYSATITATTGPITASLTGLDGMPTQTISLFRLTALSTGAIPLDADLTSPGEGTVTVQVVSLSNGSIVADATFELSIAPAPRITLTPSASQPTYGQSVLFTADVAAPNPAAPAPTGTVQFQIDGVNFGSPVTLVNGSASSSATSALGAGTHQITAVYSGDDHYGMSSLSITQTISKAVLTVAAGNLDISHGDSIPTPSYTLSGFVNSDTPSVVTGTPAFSTPPGANQAAGIYTITVAQGTLSAANYTFKFVSGTLTVHPKLVDVRIQWGSQSMSILNLNRDLPFIDINAIDLIFSDNVVANMSDLTLTGLNGTYAFSSLSYIATKDEEVWTLPTPLGIDRLMLQLDGTSATGVHTPGSDIPLSSNFSEGFSVLPGDFNGDGVVSVLDAVGVLNLTAPGSTYSVWADLEGTGVVDFNDYLDVRKRIGWQLP